MSEFVMTIGGDTVPATGSFGVVNPAQGQVFAQAPDRDAVRAFYQAALATGAEPLHEPQLWPQYHPDYYGAFVRDPDGNNIEAVCHTPE